MNDADLKLFFRKNELQNRSARRKVLLNEAALLSEPLSEEERKITEDALKALRTFESEYQKAVHGSYWRRLWAALWGR